MKYEVKLIKARLSLSPKMFAFHTPVDSFNKTVMTLMEYLSPGSNVTSTHHSVSFCLSPFPAKSRGN